MPEEQKINQFTNRPIEPIQASINVKVGAGRIFLTIHGDQITPEPDADLIQKISTSLQVAKNNRSPSEHEISLLSEWLRLANEQVKNSQAKNSEGESTNPESKGTNGEKV